MSNFASDTLGNYITEYSVRNKNGADIPVYSVSNDKGFCRDYFSKDVSSKDKSSYKIVPRGCFAYNPSRINVGSIDWQHIEDNVIVSPLYVVFSTNDINNDFLLYYLKSNALMSYIKIYSAGSVRNNLRFKTLASFPVKVPSLETQRLIVAELDSIIGIIEKKKEQLKELDNLAQSIFYNMFGDLIANEQSWEVKKLGDICVPKKSILRANKVFKKDETIHYIDISSVDNTQAVLTGTTSFVFGEAPSRAQQQVEKNDILVSMVRPNLKNIAMVQYEDIYLVASSGFCVLRAKDCNPFFIKAFVLTERFTRYLTDLTTGANYPAVREEDIKKCVIGVPPLNLQNEYAKKIENIERQKELIKRSIEETETLFNSRMDYWFNK